MGGAYHLSDEHLAKSHKLHDLDGNGNVTKDEVVWARRLKSRFYAAKKSGGSKSGSGSGSGKGKGGSSGSLKLTPAVIAVYNEDNDLFLKLDPNV